MPVVGEVGAGFNTADTGQDQQIILFIQRWIPEQHAGDRIAAVHAGLGCESGTEVKPSVSTVGLILGDLAPANIHTKFQCMSALCPGDVVEFFESVLASENR